MRDRLITGVYVQETSFQVLPEITTWYQLVGLVRDLSLYVGLGLRSPKVQADYDQQVQELKASGLSSDYMIRQELGDQPYCYLINKFPYDLLIQPLNSHGINVEHGCVWSQFGGLTETVVTQVMYGVPGVTSWVAYIQPREYRSVPAIEHCHVFSLKSE